MTPAVGARARLSRGAASAASNPFLLPAVLYVVARVLAFDGVEAREFRDTFGYRTVAAAPLFTSDFLAGGFPPTVPLVYKVLGTDGLRLAGQLVISMACWLALAAATASSLLDRRVRFLAFAAILVFSLSPDILLWDALLLSESVAISLTAALVAAWLLFVRRPTPWGVAVVLALTGLWTLSRDPHAYVLLLLAAVLAASLAFGGHRLLRALVLVGVLAISAASLVLASVHYKRWQYPLQNVVAVRIAADPEGLDYFRRAGMPVTRDFLEQSRQYRTTGEDPFLHPRADVNPSSGRQLLPFQLWLMEDGRHTYVAYLLSHPGAVAEALGDLDHSLLDPEVSAYEFDPPPTKFPLLPGLVYPRDAVLPLVYLALVAMLAVAVARRSGPRRTWVVPIFLVANSLPFALLVWHAEVLELDRHGLIGALSLRLGTLLLALMLVDEIARRARRPRVIGPSAA